MQTFKEFKERMRREIWPSGEARTLRGAHDPFFNEAMMDLQHWVECLRQFNVSTYEFANTFWENAKTVVNAPWGKIRRVYTVAGGTDRWRDKVKYRSSTYAVIECWANNLFEAITPTNTGLPVLALGYRFADATQDSTVGRSRIGIWAVERKRLYIAPYLQSDELLVVDWDGQKSKWLDSDGVDETYWTSDVEEAIKYYVLFKHELMWGDRAASKDFKTLYDGKLADLIHKCNEFTAQQAEHTCDGTSGGSELVNLTTGIIDDDDDPTTDPTDADQVVFVHVADVGNDTADSEAVAAKAQSDNPELLIGGGDLSYNGNYATDFAGNYQWALTAGIVLPCIGNHDYDVISAYHAFFTLPAGRNYYEFVHGPIHFFVLNSDPREPDGRSVSSIQAEWLRIKALLSPARWKVVVLHHPPYSSGSTYGSQTVLQYPFADWSIDLVLAGHEHNFERITASDGVTHIVNGLGGASIYPFGSAVTGSELRYNSKAGRLIGTCDCDTMRLQFKNVDDELIDETILTHA